MEVAKLRVCFVAFRGREVLGYGMYVYPCLPILLPSFPPPPILVTPRPFITGIISLMSVHFPGSPLISVRPLPWTLTVLERTNPSVDTGPTDGTGTTPDLGIDQLRDSVFIIFPTQPHITDFNIRVPIRRWNPLTQHVSHFTICMLLCIY